MGEMADYYAEAALFDELEREANGQIDGDKEQLEAIMKSVKKRARKAPAKLRAKTQEEKDRELLANNKFYVGSPTALTRGWGHKTLAKAVAHAEQVLDERSGELDYTFVVQIVRVVRRQRTPALVSKL